MEIQTSLSANITKLSMEDYGSFTTLYVNADKETIVKIFEFISNIKPNETINL